MLPWRGSRRNTETWVLTRPYRLTEHARRFEPARPAERIRLGLDFAPADGVPPAERGREAGSAALEFIALGVILLVPLVYLVLALGAIQDQTLGVESTARHAARTMSAASDADDGQARAAAAVRSGVEDYDLDRDAVTIEVRCAPAGVDCSSAGATVVVTVRATVRLPLLPSILGLDRVATVPVQASSAYKVSRTWTGR